MIVDDRRVIVSAELQCARIRLTCLKDGIREFQRQKSEGESDLGHTSLSMITLPN